MTDKQATSAIDLVLMARDSIRHSGSQRFSALAVITLTLCASKQPKDKELEVKDLLVLFARGALEDLRDFGSGVSCIPLGPDRRSTDERLSVGLTVVKEDQCLTIKTLRLQLQTKGNGKARFVLHYWIGANINSCDSPNGRKTATSPTFTLVAHQGQ